MIFIYLGHSINNIVQLASHSKVSRTTYYLRKYKQIFYVQLLIKYFIRFFFKFQKKNFYSHRIQRYSYNNNSMLPWFPSIDRVTSVNFL